MTETRYTQKELKERGWTVTLINTFLGDPDTVEERGWGTYKHIAYGYDSTRVQAAEEHPDFRAIFDKLQARRAHRKEEAERQQALYEQKEDAFYADVERIPVVVEDVSLEQCIVLVIDPYRSRAFSDRRFFDWGERRFLLRRLMLNHIRHCATNYGQILAGEDRRRLVQKHGIDVSLDPVLHDVVNDAILEAYPMLRPYEEGNDEIVALANAAMRKRYPRKRRRNK